MKTFNWTDELSNLNINDSVVKFYYILDHIITYLNTGEKVVITTLKNKCYQGKTQLPWKFEEVR